MRKLSLLNLCLVCFIGAGAQTAAEIIAKNTGSLGGADALAQIKTAKLSGTVEVSGYALPLVQYVVTDHGVKTHVEVMGTEVLMSYKDGKGWKVNQFAGVAEPTPMDEGELEDALEQTSVAPPLYVAQKNGDQFEFAGTQTIDGKSVLVLKGTNKSGRLTNYFLDAGSFDLIKTVGPRKVNGQELEVITDYSNYKKTGTLQLPHSVSISANGQVIQSISIDTYEFNIPVDDKIFDMPK